MSILAIDLGARRIGIAISTSGELSTPHSVIRNEGDVIARIARLGEELATDLFVVGTPRRRHASTSDRKYETFAEALRQKTCKEVVLWNEALTTVEASDALRATGHSRRDAQRQIDMHAAAIILQSYLDHRAGRTP